MVAEQLSFEKLPLVGSHSKENSIRRPLVPAAAAAISGIAFGVQFQISFIWALALLAGMFFLIVLHVRRQHPCLWPVLFFCFVVGYFTIQPYLPDALPENHVSRFVNQGKWKITGVVDNQPEYRDGTLSFVLNVSSITQAQRDHFVTGLVKVTVRLPAPGLERGDKAALKGHLRDIRNFGNPGSFDYVRFMAFKRIYATVYASKGSLECLARRFKLPDIKHAIDTMRMKLSALMQHALAGRSDDTVSVLKALLIGDREQMPEALRQAFSRAGVGHLLAISGLHIGLIANVVFLLSCAFFAWIPWLTNRGWVRKAASLPALAGAIGYGVLAGLSASTQRSVVMVLVYLMAFWIGRRQNAINSVAVAALLIVLVSPVSVLSISFQLSFCAVLFILLGLNALITSAPEDAPEQKSWLIWVKQHVFTLFKISMLAMAATLPIAAHYFNQISLVGPIANIVVVPLAGSFAVPCGLLGVAGSFFNQAIAQFFWQVAAYAIDIVLYFVRAVAHWPWAAVKIITPGVFEMVLYYGVLAVIAGWRRCAYRIWVISFLFFLISMDAAYWWSQRYSGKDLQVVTLDAGSSSANVLTLPGGFTVLIDGAGLSGFSSFDATQRIVAPFLWHQKIKTVDLVILSNPDTERLKGLFYIFEHFQVNEVWSSRHTVQNEDYRILRRMINQGNIDHQHFETLGVNVVRNGVMFEFFSSPDDSFGYSKHKWPASKKNLPVLRVCYGRVSFLFSNTIGTVAEKNLVAQLEQGSLKSTVLYVPNSGSRSSGCSRFLEAVGAREAIIAVRRRYQIGFSHQKTLKRLADTGSRIWRTDLHGAISVWTNGEHYRVTPFRDARQQY
ncbi:MAG: DNA internalization-related competence protein ComEC/Rec2 [Desulfobacteraceae bacterium]|nr:DNA internalization-related competence protein ComEC/Rec2 [Desulfobacteraceae bacterium]